MTEITGREPRHWHDRTTHQHRMPDPRPYGLRGVDPDTKAYAAHLAEHEASTECPDRMPGDHESVTALFDLIDSRFEEIKKMRLIIIALRQKFAAAPEPDEKEDW